MDTASAQAHLAKPGELTRRRGAVGPAAPATLRSTLAEPPRALTDAPRYIDERYWQAAQAR